MSWHWVAGSRNAAPRCEETLSAQLSKKRSSGAGAVARGSLVGVNWGAGTLVHLPVLPSESDGIGLLEFQKVSIHADDVKCLFASFFESLFILLLLLRVAEIIISRDRLILFFELPVVAAA